MFCEAMESVLISLFDVYSLAVTPNLRIVYSTYKRDCVYLMLQIYRFLMFVYALYSLVKLLHIPLNVLEQYICNTMQ